MSDTTTPDLMPCAHCGGVAEQDYRQSYRSIAGRLGEACAIYCTSCSANMTLCHEDHTGVSVEHLMDELVAAWNRRAIPTTPAPAVDEAAKPRILLLPSGAGVCVGGRWDGWMVHRHPDGQWVSDRRLPEVDPFASGGAA